MSECILCKYTGSKDNVVVAEVIQYITDSVGRVHVDEISNQVCRAMNSELEITISPEDVAEHINTHTLDQRVVLHSILGDLIGMARNIKDCSIVQDPDSGVMAVDSKALLAYLKTIDQITNIYKMESMRPGAKS